MINNIEFANPYFFLLLLIIPIMIFLRFKKGKKVKAINVPNISAFKTKSNWKGKLYPILFWIRIITVILMIIALARPRAIHISEVVKKEKGIDIILSIDISLSMLAKDLKPDRLEALKVVAEVFVKERKIDRIGLVAYSGEAMMMVPLTSDKSILIQQIQNLKPQVLEGGTAIGAGLATSINHLKNSTAKSKIIILMTDGVNNDGFIDPEIAAEIATDKDIKIYTIGIGTNGVALFPAYTDNFGTVYFEESEVEIDEVLLKIIAEKTGGQYFRATDAQALKDIYEIINKLEKSDINQLKYYSYTEKYRYFLNLALLFLCMEFLLRTFVFRTIN